MLNDLEGGGGVLDTSNYKEPFFNHFSCSFSESFFRSSAISLFNDQDFTTGWRVCGVGRLSFESLENVRAETSLD